jgi:hypothetical protein
MAGDLLSGGIRMSDFVAAIQRLSIIVVLLVIVFVLADIRDTLEALARALT